MNGDVAVIKPIPKEAEEAVNFLRRWVTRPSYKLEGSRFHVTTNTIWPEGAYCCPFGLVKGMDWPAPQPYTVTTRYGINQGSADAFMRWWDSESQKDGKAAMDMLWPTRKP